jgi:hypothetical protein
VSGDGVDEAIQTLSHGRSRDGLTSEHVGNIFRKKGLIAETASPESLITITLFHMSKLPISRLKVRKPPS